MFPINLFRRNPRPYANRLPPKLARRAMLSVRVHEAARQSVVDLAEARGMSASEYVYRVLTDHLRDVVQQRDLRNPTWTTR